MKPNILIRKSDNAVIGVGYTRFEGVKNITTDYKIREIEDNEMLRYSEQMKQRTETERKAKEIEEGIKRDQVMAKLKVLGLTNEEVNILLKR